MNLTNEGKVDITKKPDESLAIGNLRKLLAYRVVARTQQFDHLRDCDREVAPEVGDIVIVLGSHSSCCLYNCTKTEMVDSKVTDKLRYQRAHDIESITLSWDHDR